MFEKVLIREGLDIALQYFNHGHRQELPVLTRKAQKWSKKYFGGTYHNPKGVSGLTDRFPDIFNLAKEPHLRLLQTTMPVATESTVAEAHATLEQLRRAERLQEDSEPFPAFMEPMMATEEEMDEVFQLRHRRPAGKSTTPMKREELRSSGLVNLLPEFIAQLGSAILLKTETHEAPAPAQVEVVSTRRRRSTSLIDWRNPWQPKVEQPAAQLASPNKIRLHIPQYPPPKLDIFDVAQGKLITVDNPAARDLSPDPFAAFQEMRKAAAVQKAVEEEITVKMEPEEDDDDVVIKTEPRSPNPLFRADSIESESSLSDVDTNFSDSFDHDNEGEADAADKPPSPAFSSITSASSEDSCSRIIRIKVPPGRRRLARTPSSPSSPPPSSPSSSMSSSSRIIKLRDPRLTPQIDRPVVVSPRGSSIIRIRMPKRMRSPSPMDLAKADEETTSASAEPVSRPVRRIKVVSRTTEDGGSSGKRTSSVEDGEPEGKRRKLAA